MKTKIKAYDYSRIYININKFIRKRLKEWGYSESYILYHIKYLEDALGCCVFKNHEIGLRLESIKLESDLYNIDFYKFISKTISHEVMELLCNDEIGGYDISWHYFAFKLRRGGFGV